MADEAPYESPESAPAVAVAAGRWWGVRLALSGIVVGAILNVLAVRMVLISLDLGDWPRPVLRSDQWAKWLWRFYLQRPA